jgi:hypothetical protein
MDEFYYAAAMIDPDILIGLHPSGTSQNNENEFREFRELLQSCINHCSRMGMGPLLLCLTRFILNLFNEAEENDPYYPLDVKVQPYSKISEGKIDSCSICFEKFQSENSVVQLDCKHLYHETCIRRWGRRKPNCPMCRQIIPTKVPEDD